MSTRSNQQVQATPRAGAWFPQVAEQLGAVLLDTLGLEAAAEWHAHRFQKYTGIRYALTVNDTEGLGAPEAYSTGLFEMLGDALTYVACSAGRVSRVDIALNITPREVAMTMRHDGIGAGDAMVGIRRRAQAYRGQCEVARAPEAGTTLTVRLPLR